MSNIYGLVESVKQCSYPSKMMDYIANIIIEIMNISPQSKVFNTVFKNENIIGIKYNIQTQFKDKKFDIPILIYLVKNMPYEVPEVYLEKNQDTGVNPKNTEIDQRTNRIMTPSLLNWNSQMTLLQVIKEITESFKKNFPIYKIAKTSTVPVNTNYNMGQSNVSYMGSSQMNQSNTNFNMSNVMSNIPQPYYSPNTVNTSTSPYYLNQSTMGNVVPNYNTMSKSNSGTNTSNVSGAYTNFYQNLAKQPPAHNTIYQSIYGQQQPQNFNQFNNLGGSIYSDTNQIGSSYYSQQGQGVGINQNYTGYNINTGFNPNVNSNLTAPPINDLTNINLTYDTKKAEEEIKKILIEEIKQNVESKLKEELKRQKQTEEKLTNYKNECHMQIDKYQKFFNRKEEIVNGLRKLLDDIEREIQNVQIHLSKMQDKMLNHNSIENQINISDPNLLRIISIEATIEDFMGVIKKSYERNIINFNDTAKTIRSLSREAVKIKFYREKLMKMKKI